VGSVLDIHVNRIYANRGAGPYHYHSNAANFFYVLDGNLEIRIEQVPHLVQRGDAVLIPPRVAHAIAVADSAQAEILEIYCPAGADFVEVDPLGGARG
jgi:quercetin dioxygenase-like cupin family protein